MIKGIHHSMIELADTGNEYYERAILIVKPAYASAQRTVLEQEARRMLRHLDAPSAFRRRKFLLRPLITGGICLLAGLFTGLLLR